jgi:hypothetical protein
MRRNDGVPEEVLPGIFNVSYYDGENYQPYAPQHAFFPKTIEDLKQAGRFEQDKSDPYDELLIASKLIRGMNELYLDGERSYEQMPLMAYQLWNTLDWRKQLASPDVAERFMQKLYEEVMETIEAFGSLRDNPKSQELKDEFVSELGDTLFCATAAATLLGADIERGTAVQLLDTYGESVRYPALGYIDNLVLNGMNRRDELYPDGHYPYMLWNLYNHEETWEGDINPPAILTYLCQPLVNALIPQAEADIVIDVGSPYRDMAEQMTGKLWIYAAFYSRYYAGVPLSEVVKKNMAKISGRVSEGSLDDKSRRTETTL